MTDYTKLTERLRTDSAFDFTTLGNEAADAIEALQAKLNAMGKGEPVAWQFRTNGKHWHVVQVCPPDDAYDKGTLSPLYAAPKALAPLTDEQVVDIAKALRMPFNMEFVRAIEAAHGVGGTQ